MFIAVPLVIKDNKDNDIKTILKLNPQYLTSYFEYTHLHDNEDTTVVTCLDTCGGRANLATPIPMVEFEKIIKPYLLQIGLDLGHDIKWKEVPIRYKDFQTSELMGKDSFIDEILKFNPLMMPYYHKQWRKYNDEDVEVVYFPVGQGHFYTLLSIEEFEAILNS